MKKYIIIFALLLPITFYFTPNIFAQTTEENQKTSCNNKKNGDACTYEEINSTSGRGTGNSTSKVAKNGFCDRVNGNNDVNNNSLTCRTGQTDWGDCVVEGDACLGEIGGGRGGRPRELGTCTNITSSGSPRGASTTTLTCDTTKKPTGTPGGFNPSTGGLSASNGTTSSSSTTAGTVSYESYTNFPGVGRISDLCQLTTALWLLGFAVLLTSVLGMFLWGGYIYVTAGVNAGKVNQAKEIFTNSITGLIIGLSIFVIINVINPGLLQGNCSIPPIGSTGTGAGQPTLGGEPYTGGPTASVVDVGRFIESRMGLRVREHSAWNGGRPITGGHSIGSLHYSDRALDITDWRRPGEPESVWLPRMRALDRAWSPIASKYGIQFFGPVTDPIGHPTHIHLGFPTGSVSSAALDEMLAAERQVLQQYPLR